MKRNSSHTECNSIQGRPLGGSWRAVSAAFLATLLALPVHAGVTIPTDPLASGVRVAPNILFILDDSGSMSRGYMPDAVPMVVETSNLDDSKTSGCDGNSLTGMEEVACNAYTRNTLSYNPAVSYSPWMNADGTRLTGGTSYASAYSDPQAVPYTGVKDDGTVGVITTSGTTDLSSGSERFYVPKDPANDADTYTRVVSNYNLYLIPEGGDDILTTGTYGSVTATSISVSPSSGSLANNTAVSSVTANVPILRSLVITIENTTGGNNTAGLNYTVKSGSVTICNGSVARGGSKTCPIGPATSSRVYTITIQRANSVTTGYTLSARSSNSCDGVVTGSSWINCVPGKPNNSRTVAQELANYATWYSYFRTRNKAAKAGAAEAFNAASLGNKVRVGFTTIWDSNPYYIPVGDGNDGRFINNDGANGNRKTYSRSIWYSHLFKAGGPSSQTTPLQAALDRAGKYFSNAYSGKTGKDGPYGPETGSAVLSCRQNFSILTTDGYWNVSTVDKGDADSTNGDTITNGLLPSDPKYKSYRYTSKGPYKDGRSKTLADVAMYYWKTDLMSSGDNKLENNVPSSYPADGIGDDPAFWQHMVTFGISIGLKTWEGLSSVDQVKADTTWPDPKITDLGSTSIIPERIDDLLHAAVNGRGSFVAATNPQEFSDGLAAALAKINERSASFSNAGASDSTQLNSGTQIFTASYVSGRWSGLLRAESAVSGAEMWKTTSTGIFPAYGSRKIYTRGGTLTDGVGADGVGSGTTFPTSAQSAVLARTGGPANYEVTATDNVNYIKGQQTKEGSNPGQLRVRSTVMGDVVNSSPAYVADSNTVFVGANDGMLHAFNASTGAEQFAYIPNTINFGRLADLSRGDYEHHWFVDGPIVISPKALSPDGAKNILVGSLGRGGKGIYALNVTSPAAFGASDVMWERASTSATTASDNMGMVLGAPVLAKVRTGGTMPSPTLTSAVVLGNGINSGSDKAALLVLDMTDGHVIKEIKTDDTTGNGLFAPTGIYAADGKTLIYVYAGDLQGNLWKFDLTSTSPASWSARKIFHAEKTAGSPQAITGGIASAVDARTNKRWVFFGTGSYMTAADGNDVETNKQSMYGVMDDLTSGSGYTRSDLVARTVTSDGADERYFQPLTSVLMGAKHGWYVDLPDKGERIVQNAQIDGSFLVTASMMPSGNSCADAAGSGYINAITPFPDMIANGKSYFDLDGDGNSDDTGTSGKPTGSVKTGGMPTLPLLLPGQLRYQTSSGSGEKLTKGQPQWNRVSWREIRND